MNRYENSSAARQNVSLLCVILPRGDSLAKDLDGKKNSSFFRVLASMFTPLFEMRVLRIPIVC